MIVSALVMFVVGLFGANGVPHFVKGITRSPYPMIFSNRPVPNLLAGWGSLVVAGLLWMIARPEAHPWPAFAGCALGALAMGLFHAGPGAFGRAPAAPDRRETSGDRPD
ncbi:hypothetical protein [Leifsonia poae]|uniref:hypothetical protein n=1 Tax=Leifsonia poae TaxID=110933 RepID=UPI001CBD6A26|nr:hypothetical protein [Leifsonia poae]